MIKEGLICQIFCSRSGPVFRPGHWIKISDVFEGRPDKKKPHPKARLSLKVRGDRLEVVFTRLFSAAGNALIKDAVG